MDFYFYIQLVADGRWSDAAAAAAVIVALVRTMDRNRALHTCAVWSMNIENMFYGSGRVCRRPRSLLLEYIYIYTKLVLYTAILFPLYTIQ